MKSLIVKFVVVMLVYIMNGCSDAGKVAIHDATPPSVPTGLSASVISTTSIALNWTESTDNVGVAGYRVYRDGMQIVDSKSTSCTDTGLASSTTYNYTVSARDVAGNVSEQSSIISVTTLTMNLCTGITCNDNNPCTTDACDPATGGCVFNSIPGCGGIHTTRNNVTIISSLDGSLVGGGNDVSFSWDGTLKTSVAESDQVPNATLATTSHFAGYFMFIHDVAIYGPGIYTVNACCPARNPGCKETCSYLDAIQPITFTVGEGELGVHLLLDWYVVNKDMDVVNVWKPNAAFGPSALWTGEVGSSPADKVWDWMSKDCYGDGINGTPIIESGLNGYNVNINVMVTGNPGTPCALPWGGTIEDGQRVNAYEKNYLACGSYCSQHNEYRTCQNGVLDGSYQYQSCREFPCP